MTITILVLLAILGCDGSNWPSDPRAACVLAPGGAASLDSARADEIAALTADVTVTVTDAHGSDSAILSAASVGVNSAVWSEEQAACGDAPSHLVRLGWQLSGDDLEMAWESEVPVDADLPVTSLTTWATLPLDGDAPPGATAMWVRGTLDREGTDGELVVEVVAADGQSDEAVQVLSWASVP